MLINILSLSFEHYTNDRNKFFFANKTRHLVFL